MSLAQWGKSPHPQDGITVAGGLNSHLGERRREVVICVPVESQA